MGTIRDFLFQIVLFVLSVFLSVTVPLLPRERQQKIARIFAVLFFITSILWGLIEYLGLGVGYRNASDNNPLEMTSEIALEKFFDDGVVEKTEYETYMVRTLSEEKYYLYGLENNSVRTKVVFDGRYTENGNNYYVLISETKPAIELCDPCDSVIGMVVFKTENGFWEIKAKQEVAYRFTNYVMDSISGELTKIGPDKYTFALSRNDYGYSMRETSISNYYFMENNNNFSLVFERTVHFEFVNVTCSTQNGDFCWRKSETALSLINGRNPNYYDMQVIGYESWDMGSGEENVPINEVYSFDGIKYQTIK